MREKGSGGEIIVCFVKCVGMKLEADCVFLFGDLRRVIRLRCPGFRSAGLKWAHLKTEGVWQGDGSLCLYEAPNLMSMNNE